MARNWYSSRLSWAWLVACVLPQAVPVRACGADPSIDRLVQRWRQLEDAEDAELRSYTVDYTAAITAHEAKGATLLRRAATYHVRRMPGYRYVRADGEGETDIYARSPRYVFAIRSAAGGQSGWVLRAYADDPNGPQAKQIDQAVPGGPALGARYPLSIVAPSTTLAQWFGSRKVASQSAAVQEGGVRIEYALASGGAGALVLDPTRDGVVLRSDRRIPLSGPTAGRYPDSLVRELEPAADDGRLPRCRRITSVARDAVENSDLNTVKLEFRDYSYDDIPEEIFYLSHYGLPEPPGFEPPRRKTPTYWWLLAAAAGFGLLAVVFWRLRRRGRAAPPPAGG